MDKLIDSIMEKYGLPTWIKPYVYRYARENPMSTVKYAISLIDVKRKKGEVTKTNVRLPNGTIFEMESVLKLLNLFFYGEENMARIERIWGTGSKDHNAEYENNFMEMAEIDMKRTRAIKNLAEGLGHNVGQQPESLAKTFDYISRIEPWSDRVITTGIILRYSYAVTFGIVFYKAFYPVSPEFMRSFGKAFERKDVKERWDTEEAGRLVQAGAVNREHVLQLTREVLSLIFSSIDGNMRLAKELGLEKEVKLLSDISIAYPFQKLLEMGMEVDVEKEVKLVKSMPQNL